MARRIIDEVRARLDDPNFGKVRPEESILTPPSAEAERKRPMYLHEIIEETQQFFAAKRAATEQKAATRRNPLSTEPPNEGTPADIATGLRVANHLTAQQLAAKLNCSIRHAKRLMAGMDNVKNIGTGSRKMLRVPEESVESFLSTRDLSKPQPRRRRVQ
ncbi:MAG: hypothetical protein U0R19_37535 [Bryobacteraceae bacterium]